MKKLIYIFFFLPFQLFATNYYVATDGNDNNAGTLAQPWASWQYAFNLAMAGDTVFYRGGIYYAITNGTGIKITNDGTHEKWIVHMAYPPDLMNGNRPILDFGQMTAEDILYPGIRHDGITNNGKNYIKLSGLTIRNVKQYFNRNYARGILLRDGITIVENCVVYNCWGHGIHSQFSENAEEECRHYIINCDAYNNCDSISGDPIGSNAGATGAGFDAWSDGLNGRAYFHNCRAWGNSDQGYSIGSDAYVECVNCWSFANKNYFQGGGAGYKLGWQNIDVPHLRRQMINCVAAFNDSYGFLTNERGSGGAENWYAVKSNHYNNIAYNNGHVMPSHGFGFIIQNTTQSEEIQHWRNFSNNIAYNNHVNIHNAVGAAKYSGSNNTWDIPLTLTDADFISIDSTGLSAPRQPDGSLPDNDCYRYFLKLSPLSKLIDAGVDVGLPYVGAAPDLGPFEYKGNQIIADHTIVDDYDKIPQYYIDEVKKMWVSYAGESHSLGISTGLSRLEDIDPKYVVQYRGSGNPTGYINTALRISRATWGDLNNSSGWIYGYGEEDWFTSPEAIARTKAGLTYIDANGPDLYAFGFGWCWDAAIDTPAEFIQYINATKEYINHCEDNSIGTQVFFTTGPVDGSCATGETGWEKYLGYEQIRDSVKNNFSRILFDYADILTYDYDSEVPNTNTWNGNIYPIITSTNLGDGDVAHISETGAIRLAKAMWWMLARMAGWDGAYEGEPGEGRWVPVVKNGEFVIRNGRFVVKYVE